MAKPTTTEADIELIKTQQPLYDFDPGMKWKYDNSGYELLGYIVEKVSGESYGDFLREFLPTPGHDQHRRLRCAHLSLPHEAARAIAWATNAFEPPFYIDPSHAGGDGALYSTVEDLYRWSEGIFNGRVLDAASLKAAFTPVATKASQINSGNGYGFGWYVGPYRGLRDISHGGERPGFASMMLRLPDENFTVAVLANANPGRPDATPNRLAYQIVDIYLADKLAHSTPSSTPTVSPNPKTRLDHRLFQIRKLSPCAAM